MSKKISIAFPQGGIVPGSVLGTKEDQACAAMEPVSVPEAYGRHLIDDRFAVEVADVHRGKKNAKSAGKGSPPANPDNPEVIAAKAAVVEAEQLVAASGSDADAKAEAETMLAAAQENLAALEA